MIFTPLKIFIAIAMVIGLHIFTNTPFDTRFIWLDLFSLAVAYVIVLACQAVYLTAKTRYEYARDKAAAEAELLKEYEEYEESRRTENMK